MEEKRYKIEIRENSSKSDYYNKLPSIISNYNEKIAMSKVGIYSVSYIIYLLLNMLLFNNPILGFICGMVLPGTITIAYIGTEKMHEEFARRNKKIPTSIFNNIIKKLDAKVEQLAKKMVIQRGLIVREEGKKKKVPFTPEDYENYKDYEGIKNLASHLSYPIEFPHLHTLDLIIDGEEITPSNISAKVNINEIKCFIMARLTERRELSRLTKLKADIEKRAAEIGAQIHLREPERVAEVGKLIEVLKERKEALILGEENQQVLADLSRQYNEELKRYMDVTEKLESISENHQYSLGTIEDRETK